MALQQNYDGFTEPTLKDYLGLGKLPAVNSKYGVNYSGNIDLNNRQVLRHPDGSIGTEYSLGISDGKGNEYLIPQIVGGKMLPKEEAIAHFNKTGEHLGTRATPTDKAGWDDWEKYSNNIHIRQSRKYGKE